MADSQKAVEAVGFPMAPTRPERYDAATRAVLDNIDPIRRLREQHL